MKKKKIFGGVCVFFAIITGAAIVMSMLANSLGAETIPPVSIYHGDSIKITIKGYVPTGHPVPYGTNVKGVLFDGYPQLVKEEGSKPVYKIKKEKDIMVPMRDGIRLCTDVYRPDVEGEKFPAILV